MTLSAPPSDMLVHSDPVAVLVDGENIAAAHAGAILAGAVRAGGARIRRVYGNAALLTAWNDCPDVDLVHTHCGKNSADMKLAIDAVDLAARGGLRRFLIASSDGDFSHLAQYLREAGCDVLGMGGPQTPEKFRRACGRFVPLDMDPAEDEAPPNCLVEATELQGVLTGLPLHAAVAEILRRERGTGWTGVGMVNALVRRHLDIRISSHPDKTWARLLSGHPDLFHCDGTAANRRVRLRGR